MDYDKIWSAFTANNVVAVGFLCTIQQSIVLDYVVHTLLVLIYYWIDTASDPLDLVPSQIHTFTKNYAVRHSWTSRIAAYNSVKSFFRVGNRYAECEKKH